MSYEFQLNGVEDFQRKHKICGICVQYLHLIERFTRIVIIIVINSFLKQFLLINVQFMFTKYSISLHFFPYSINLPSVYTIFRLMVIFFVIIHLIFKIIAICIEFDKFELQIMVFDRNIYCLFFVQRFRNV